ncbi:LAMI_0H01706g1_1 [Lachancea mirantina]|uniref:Signal peptidase complex subunit 2 n=1 Tax=Lachancea mirantina TaxID=1230905 RepID=A0A1G4KDS3_9SACH|nr:LAMI_0H01706g1_1 [Lachancea mirantina]
MSKLINVYASPELRQTLDEALPGVFSRLGYTENYTLIDTKLIIGYSIALLAGVSFLLDKKLDFQESLTYQKLLVAGNLVLSVVFWYYTKFVLRDVKYVGKSKSSEIKVSTRLEKNDFKYDVMLVKGPNSCVKCVLPANEVFTEAGYLQADLLYQWFQQQLKKA